LTAGGFDAIWVLVIDLPSISPAASASSPAEGVEKVWLSWKEMSVCPLSARAELAGGLRIEEVKAVEGLESALQS
jgi:phosphomevalonate kinase